MISPVSIGIHKRQLKPDEAVQVRVIVPGRFVQKEDVPVRWDEHEAGETVETAKHDSQSAFSVKHKEQLQSAVKTGCYYLFYYLFLHTVRRESNPPVQLRIERLTYNMEVWVRKWALQMLAWPKDAMYNIALREI